MTRIKTIVIILFAALFPLSFAFGQEKKNEQRVKVVVADKSGTKVLIDTVYTGDGAVDTVIMKGGSVIYIGKNGPDKSDRTGRQYEVITHIDTDGGSNEHSYVYINDDDNAVWHSGEDEFLIMEGEDDFDNDTEKSSYVIAKNGITISVEGNDEAKIKELVKVIEREMDIKNEATDQEPGVKAIEKNTVKKK